MYLEIFETGSKILIFNKTAAMTCIVHKKQTQIVELETLLIICMQGHQYWLKVYRFSYQRSIKNSLPQKLEKINEV